MVRADLMDCVEKFLRLNGPRPGSGSAACRWSSSATSTSCRPWSRAASAASSPRTRPRSAAAGARPPRRPPTTAWPASPRPPATSRRTFSRPASSASRPSTWSSSSSRRSTARPTPPSSRSSTPSATARSTSRRSRSSTAAAGPSFSPPDGEFYITLTSTNDLAAVRNREKLAALPGPGRRYEGLDRGRVRPLLAPDRRGPRAQAGGAGHAPDERPAGPLGQRHDRPRGQAPQGPRRRRHRRRRPPGRRARRPLAQHLGALPLPLRGRGATGSSRRPWGRSPSTRCAWPGP